MVNSDQEFICVGKNCMRDFLGHSNPNDVASLMELIFSAMGAAGEEEGGGGGGRASHLTLSYFLGHVARSVRGEGWLSRTAARQCEGKYSTADIALETIYKEEKGQLEKELRPTAEDFARGDAAIEFMKTFLETAEINDYLHNLSVVLKMGVVNRKMSGLAASILVTAEREQAKEIERRKFLNLKQTSKFLGEVKGKIQVKASVLSVKELESPYGVTTMVKFLTEDESLITWFASGSQWKEWSGKKDFTLAATVKKHEEYQGVKQTIVTRCVAMTEEAVRLEAEKAQKKAAREAKKAAKAAVA